MPEEGGDQGNGAVGRGGIRLNAQRTKPAVGGNQMVFTGLWSWTSSTLGQATSFRGKEVLLPRHHGQGLAHQNPFDHLGTLVLSNCLQKAANGGLSIAPGRRCAGGCSFHRVLQIP